jgi:hypothetical protein
MRQIYQRAAVGASAEAAVPHRVSRRPRSSDAPIAVPTTTTMIEMETPTPMCTTSASRNFIPTKTRMTARAGAQVHEALAGAGQQEVGRAQPEQSQRRGAEDDEGLARHTEDADSSSS